MFFDSALQAVRRRFGGEPRGAAAPLAVEAQAPSPTPVIHVRASNVQPQSDREIQPIVEALQQMDPLLGIRWNPEARLLKPGSYSETGKLIAPEYEGRWNVTRQIPRDDRRHYEGREYIVICEVTEPKREQGVLYMERGGAYAPIGEWLLEYMRAADAANVRIFEDMRKKVWAQHDRTDEQEGELDEAMAREGLNRAQFKANYAGRVGNWHPVKTSLTGNDR